MNNNRQHYYFLTMLIGIFILVGLLAVRYDRRIDVTFDGRNSLHPNSVEVVKQLDAPLSITAFSRGNPQVKKLIQRLLEKYRQHVDIRLNLQNPDTAIDLVQAYQITRDGELIIEYKGQKTHVEDLSERSITRAIYRLLQPASKEITFVIGHGERDLGNVLSDYGALSEKLQTGDFKVGQLDLNLAGQVPKTTDVLVIADARQPYAANEIQAVIDYLNSGGKLLWLGEADSQPLPDLVAYLGAKITPHTLINRLSKKYQLNQPDYIVIEPTSDLVVLNNINTMLLFPKASPIERLPTAASQNWHALTFLQPTGESFVKQSKTIAKAEKAVPLGTLLTANQAEQSQKAVLIGDADFLSNQFIGFGQNTDFALNLFSYLSAVDDAFIQVGDDLPPPVVVSEKTMGYLALIFMLLVPVAILIIGLLVRAILRRKV